MSQCEEEHQRELERLNFSHDKFCYQVHEKHERAMGELGRRHEKELAYKDSLIRELSQRVLAATSEQEQLKGLLRSAETDARRLRLQLERTGSDHLDVLAQRVTNLEKDAAQRIQNAAHDKALANGSGEYMPSYADRNATAPMGCVSEPKLVKPYSGLGYLR